MHMVRALMCFVEAWPDLEIEYWAISSISLKITLYVHWGIYNPGQHFSLYPKQDVTAIVIIITHFPSTPLECKQSIQDKLLVWNTNVFRRISIGSAYTQFS